MVYYITTILVYAGVDAIACLGLSQQLGIAGVTNLGFIIFQAAGAYAAGVLSLPASGADGGFQSYVLGWNLPFPLPWIGAAIAGGLLAIPFTLVYGRRLRGDFAAVGLLVTAVVVNVVVTNFVPLFNGAAGLSLVPSPLQSSLNTYSAGYQWGYAAASLLLAFLVYLFVSRITNSPWGRTLRAMRENDMVADSLGKDLRSLRMSSLVIGGALAGLSGGVLVGFINLWDPQAWEYAESIVLVAAIIIGGRGNHRGAVLGAVLVPVAFEEATRYIPAVASDPGLVPALEWVVIGVLIVAFLWFRPEGVLPERRRIILGSESTEAALASANEAVWTPDSVAPAEAVAVHGQEIAASRRSPAVTARDVPPLTVRPRGDSSSGDIILSCDRLTKTFDGALAVSATTLRIERGRLTGIIGPNGAGKSTTLAMLAGTLKPDSGRIELRGQDITDLPAYRRARLGLVRTFQMASEFKRLTVMENLMSAVPGQRGDSFRGALIGRRRWLQQEHETRDRAATMLERFGLTALGDRYAGNLSGGQRRLVEIMRALMAEPDVLLLDEPMAGVHPRLAHEIGVQLVALCEAGITVVMVEHELSIMEAFCDPVIVMAEGTVLAQGGMAELRENAEVVEAYLVG
jgi:branched-chain amino acid transport system permease protein